MNIEEIVDRLLELVDAVKNLWTRHSHSEFPSARYRVSFFHWEDDTRASGVEEEREELTSSPIWEESRDEVLHLRELEELSRVADAAVAEKRVDVGSWPRPGSTGGLLLSVYLSRARSFQADKSLATPVVRDFIRDVTSDSVLLRSVYAVTRFTASEDFELAEGIAFRHVTDSDIDEFCRVSELRVSLQPELGDRDWLCVVRRPVPKKNAYLSVPDELPQAIAGALSLVRPGIAAFMSLQHGFDSPFYRQGFLRGGAVIHTSRTGNPIVLSTSDIAEFRDMYGRVDDLLTNAVRKPLRLPFRRLRLASSRAERDDQLIDLVIGLERLLTPGKNTGETGYKFRIRGAALLPNSFGKAEERLDLLRDLYDTRSEIVHGGSNDQAVRELIPKAESALKAILTWYLERPAEPLERTMTAIDVALVSGGHAWAQPAGQAK